MKAYRSLQNKSVKYTWITTYIILFLLPLITLIALFFNVDGTLKSEINKSNYFLLKQVQQYMDSLVNDTEKVAINLALNDKVQYIRNVQGEIRDEDRDKLLNLYQEINKTVYNNAIQDVYVFFKNADLVVSSKNVMSSNDNFNMFAKDNGLNTNEWININNEYYTGNYINLDGKKVNIVGSDKILAYIISIPLNSDYSGFANIVVIVDKSKFLGMAEDIEALSSGNIGILNVNNEYIIKKGDFGTVTKIKYEDLKDPTGIIYDKVNNVKVAISYLSSKTKNWKYISIMPISQYWDKLEQYRKLIYTGILLCIIAGAVAAYFLFKKNYQPIQQLIQSLGQYKEKDFKDTSNEYNIIGDLISKSFKEKKEIDKWISIQKEILAHRYIENLLKGRAMEPSLHNDEILDISFSGQYFAVLSFSMEDLIDVMRKDTSNVLESFKLAQFIIHNMMKELVQNKGRVYTVDIDNSIVCLLNLLGEGEDFSLYCKEIALKIQDVIKNNYKVNLSIGISNIYKETTQINKAYKETEELKEFVDVVGGDRVIYYNEAHITLNRQYYYPLEQEQALISALKYGDFEKSKKVIEHIFNKNFKEGILNRNMVKCLKFNLIGSLINAINDIGESVGGEYLSYLNQIEELVNYKSITRLKEVLFILLNEICEKINVDKATGTQVRDKIISFIKERYKDESLNISIIAITFNLHPSYISKLFKIQTGESILDYINKMRIGEAKKIIKTESCNLEGIAKIVGYSSVKTFTRAFTKIEGVTPGKYKDLEVFTNINRQA